MGNRETLLDAGSNPVGAISLSGVCFAHLGQVRTYTIVVKLSLGRAGTTPIVYQILRKPTREETTYMSNKKNKKKQKHKKDRVRPHMPVAKPDDSHMPICSASGCNRRVSDARKTRCARCGFSVASYNDDFGYGYGSFE